MFEYNNHDFSLSVLNASTDLNSTSFQCIVGRAASSTGLLMVLNLSLEFKGEYNIIIGIIKHTAVTVMIIIFR